MKLVKLFFFLLLTIISLQANDTNVSIAPTTQSAVIGTESVFVTISISECPDSKPVTVTYVNEANTSNTGSVIFENGSCSTTKSVLILIPSSQGEGSSFNVTITGIGQNPQPNPTVIDDTATINIIPLPSNTPAIVLSPVTKNIADESTTATLNVLISECPNKEDINVTYTNEANLTDTGILTFDKLSCVSSQSFTVNVPAGLVIGDTFDVNISAITSGDQEIGAVNPDTATITILDTVSDLNITKTAVINDSTVINTIAIDETFQYIIKVENQGVSTATGIVVQDELPAGIIVDLSATNNDSGDWTCTQTAPILTCTHGGTISAGSDSTIKITVTAPSTSGSITNKATVYSDNDTDILNNEASVTTEIVDTGSATDICYTNTTAEEDHPNTCSDLTGISYYTVNSSYTCTATMTIRNADPDSTLSNVTVTKLYNPNRDNGTCTTTSGTCSPSSSLAIEDYSSYGGGYIYTLGTVIPDANITIGDYGTYYSSEDINDIILHGTYEKDGVTYTGKVSACSGGASTLNISENAAQVDVVDGYDTSTGSYVSWIGTKVSGKDNYVMNAVYLGAYGTTPAPQVYPGVANQDASITVLFKLVDMDALDAANGETCESADGVQLVTSPGSNDPVVTVISPGETSDVSQAFEMAYMPDGSTPEARKNLRFQYKTVDFNALIIESGINCVQQSSTGGVVEGIPACMIANANENQTNEQINTAIENYIAVFGEGAYQDCYTDNGQPCYASNGGVGAYPYNTEYGCFECSIGAFPASCSNDNFAIRPEKFDVNSTDNSYPDLLRAGQDYDLNVNAVADNNGIDSNLVGYNQVSSNLYVANPIKYWGEGGEANASMFGIGTWGSDFNITDGYTTIGGVATPVPYAYDDVGDISIHIEDYTWSAVDINNANDPTLHDCSADGAYICGDNNATFIPHHFAVTIDDLHNNSTADAFTYLSNDLNMSARYGVTIIAQNALDATTKNFTQPAFGHDFYENNVTVLIDAPDSLELGAAVTDDINTSLLLEFNAGVKTISWNENNETLRLAFNYPRTTNTPINPFIVGGLSNVDVNSTYTGTAPEGTANIDGTDDADDNVTFVYGRTHMARTRAMCNAGSCNGNMNFYYEFYGDEDANRTLITQLLAPAVPQRSIDSVNWYRNTEHNVSTDGNVTGSSTNNPIHIPSPGFYTTIGSTTSATYTYSGSKGYPYKGTITVLNALTGGTQSWLIYDKYRPDPATEIRGELEYYGPGKWSSDTGAAESVDDTGTEKNRNTNRRIRW